ncbi:MAG: DUF368 domain-containing protein [Ruminococcaceae bacterium]|nr:DUF368 domain-containing protein [Oscillospiraceae bacterium]
MLGVFNLRNFLNTAVCGFIIGVAAITPGLSGSVLAISLGIYPKLLGSVMNLRKDFKPSVCFLGIFAMGALLGMLVFGVVMKPLLENFERSIIWLFMGLIAGSIPSFMKEATQKGFKMAYIIPMLVAFAVGVFFTTLTEHRLTAVADSSPVMLFAAGAILAIGAIVPGISSSFVLMQIGMYDKLISSFVCFNILDMFWISLGAGIILLATIKLINLAFEKLHGYAHFAAFGFLLSSVVGVFPGIEHITDIILFVTGALLIYAFGIVTKSKNKNFGR